MTEHRHNPRLSRVVATGAAVLATFGATAVTSMVAPVSAQAAPQSAATQDERVNQRGMSPDSSAARVAIDRANEEAAFDYFVGKGLTKTQAAGVVGNLDQESGMDPTIKQIGGGPGRGIAQWGVGGRWDTYSKDNVVDYAGSKSPYGLQVQLDFTWYELSQYSYYGLSSLKKATTIESAVTAFQDDFEGCGTCATGNRVSYAKDAYSRYA